MRVMARFAPKLVTALALALSFAATQALAQGVAPGGGIGNSTGIGSGLGGVIGGTGPSYPNGTTQPTLPSAPPPGGYGGTTSPPPAASSSRPSYYPQPQEPFGSTAPRSPSTLPLSLPERPGDLSFLKGCWRSDVFRYAQHPGTSTWCFDEKGAGRFLYTRQDQAAYFCRGPAEAAYVGQQLRFHIAATTCSDKNDSYPADLDCQEGGDGAQCGFPSGQASAAVRLYRVR
jgi:hypothetical protein